MDVKLPVPVRLMAPLLVLIVTWSEVPGVAKTNPSRWPEPLLESAAVPLMVMLPVVVVRLTLLLLAETLPIRTPMAL